MSIVPLPVFEADADPHHRSAVSDQELFNQLEPPKSIVVRFGATKLVAEYPYDGPATPGCGSKLVARTHRGTEVVEMLTTTCENAGCGKSVSRQEMLQYIEHSGGADFPFHTNGRVLRVATIEDLNKQASLDALSQEAVAACKSLITELQLDMKLVEVEPILGGELLTFYYMSEQRVDFRELVRRLASQFKTRIEMRQVGARDEARLVADYERCGQHCCCKSFLKVLRPVSMRAAKLQKATLDPLKISGRCGRLMCCLRYEDQTYKELKANLPRRKSRVGTMEGPGMVIDTKLLVQLALVKLEHDGTEIAVPIEELMDPETCPTPDEAAKRREAEAAAADPLRGLPPSEVEERTEGKRRRRRKRRAQGEPQDAVQAQAQKLEAGSMETGDRGDAPESEEGTPKKKRRRRRRRRGGASGEQATTSAERSSGSAEKPADAGGGGEKKRRRRRGGRRRRKRGGGGGGTQPPA